MKEEELLKKWKDLKAIIEKQDELFKKENDFEGESKEQQEKGQTKRLSSTPHGLNRYSEPGEPENYKGFASALLLGFLVFVFQIFLFAIMYIFITQ